MIIVEPTPRSDATVIVVHHPLQSLHIAMRKFAHLLRVVVTDFQLVLSQMSEAPPSPMNFRRTI